jgi:murein L,D-transpeptidase YafK
VIALCWSGLEQASATLASVDTVVVIKSKRLLLLLKDGEIFKTYRVSLGQRPEGHKIASGDQRTPEGRYTLDAKNPKSKYHLAIHISYPNELDIINAQKRGVSPGGEIMIHGLPPKRSNELKVINGYADWTNGCIALTNPEMEEIWQFVATGTPIEIKP